VNLSDFDYDLPEELIAQRPPATRGDSRLMVLNRDGQTIEHRAFADLVGYVRPGDLLVVNDTKVIPARVEARKATGGRLSILFLDGDQAGATCLISGRGVKAGSAIRLPGEIEARVIDRDGDGGGAWKIAARFPEGLFDYLDAWGRPPLPPYIKRGAGDDPAPDRDRYQTVYAHRPGSVAAPTAGLHFTGAVMRQLEAAGARVSALTLTVGIGTFLPIRAEVIERHRMHAERYDIPPETADAVNGTRARGGRVIAVGTTATRALEGAAAAAGGETERLTPGRGETSLFITPGFRFRVVDGLVTNFHLPRSTLLVLVSAFAGREFIREAYRQAVEARYRFFSYGDAMLII
jgi:S-adenosylmethionine:tRNA ribosyltransferase-isomerase